MFHHALNALYAGDTLTLAKQEPVPFDHTAFSHAAERLYCEGRFRAELLDTDEGRALTEETYHALNAAINYAIQTETPPELTAALRNNAFIFSGFKSYHQLREASAMLTRDDGTVRSYAEFESEVRRIDEKYNTAYLRAEYNHAVHSAQMACKWHEWQADGDEYNLQYRTAGDERVREAHAALDGVTLPPSDKFWNKYLPPNGWNCRCQVVQVLREDYPQTNSDQATEWGDACTADPKEKIFRFNAGKELKLFPPKHPYLPKGCGDCSVKQNTLLLTKPDKALPQCRACGLITKQCIRQSESDIAVWKTRTIPERGALTITGSNFISGSLLITRGSVRETLGHSMNMAVRNSLYGIKTGALKYKYIGWGECSEGKHADAAYFSYYEIEIAGRKYYANVIASKSRKAEVLYCIRDYCNMSRLRHDTPPAIE